MLSYINGNMEVCRGFDAAGTFTRYGGSTIWQGDAIAGTKILSDRHDAHDQEIANGLSECLTRSGKGAPTVDISWGGKRLINLGAPTADTDAATKVYVDTFKSFTTGSIITGADLNGRVTFSSPTGINGLSWTGADLTWLAKIATAAGPGTPPVPPATLNRLVLNDKADGTGADVVEVRDDGSIKALSLTATGAVTADTLAVTNAATVGSLAATGAITAGGLLTATGAISAASLTVTGAITTGSVNSSGGVTANGFATSGQLSANTVVASGITSNGDISATSDMFCRSLHLATDGGGYAVIYTSTFGAWSSNAAGQSFGIYSGHSFGQRNSDGMFTVSSNAQKPGGGSWVNSSDARIKDVLGDYTDGLDKLLALRPKTYRLKGNDLPPDRNHPPQDRDFVGLIAQECETVMPSLVSQGPGWIDGQEVADFRTIDTSELIFTLINAVRELSAKIEALEAAA